MINELGHFALILAFAVSIAQSTIPMWGAYRGYAEPMRFAQPAAITAFLLVGLSFAALTVAFLNSDFFEQGRGGKLAQPQADALQDLRRLGEP